LRNSFDRSLRVAFVLGFLRAVCTNGAATLEDEFAMSQKHFSKASLEFIGKAVDNAMESGQSAIKIYDAMAQASITDEQGINILKRLQKKGILSGTLRQPMETLWLAPRRQEDKARNIYNLYNAVTDHLTHNVQPQRFEYADTTNNAVLMTLFNASRNPATMAKLTMPVESDGVLVTLN
jgi:hypothetical protein